MSAESNTTSTVASAPGSMVPDAGATTAQGGSVQPSPMVSTSHSKTAPPVLVMTTSCGTVWSTSCSDSNPAGSTVNSASAGTSAIGRWTSVTAVPVCAVPPWVASVVSSTDPKTQSPPTTSDTSAVTSMSCVAPGSRVNDVGVIVAAMPSGRVAVTS